MTWTIFDSPAARCDACKLFESSRVHALRGEGNPYAALMLIGEGPGEEEEYYARPFVGRAGQLLDSCLAEVGITRSECFIRNAVSCRPTTPYGKNRKPTAHEIDCCRDYTIDDIKRVRPKVIVVLGDTPATSLLGKLLGGVTDNRGKARWVEEINAWVVVTFHPAYALRLPAQRHFIIEDLRTAKAIVDEGAPRIGEPTLVQYIETLDEAVAARDEILSGRYSDFAFDWESNGVHLVKSEGFMLSISVREYHSYVFPRRHQDWMPAWSRHDMRILDREVLAPLMTSDLEKDGWHVAFDMSVSQTTLGIRPVNVQGCWMIAHHLLNAHLGERAHGLKVCAALYTDMGRYDDALDQWLIDHGFTIDGKPDMGRVWKAPTLHDFADGVTCVECNQTIGTTRPCLVPYYNGCDSDATRRLKYILKPRLIEAGLLPVFVNERMPLALDYQEMDRIGVRINVPYLDELSAHLGGALDRLEEEIVECVDPAIAAKFTNGVINPASAPQVARLLFDELDLPILARTETHQPATGEEFLLQLKDLHPVVDKILHHRTFAKIKGTWIDGRKSEKGQKKALRVVLDEDGYARMSTRTAGPETFRLATRKPFPIHTFPKNSKDYPSVRALVIPDDGYSFDQRDFCVAPETRVLTADLRWVPADSLKRGQELIGFDENIGKGNGWRHKYRSARVVRVGRFRQPCYRITTDRGTVVASADHMWIARRMRGALKGTRQWLKSKDLESGDLMSFMMACCKASLKAKDAHLRLLGMLRPPRLFAKQREFWEGKQTWSRRTKPAVVQRVDYLGTRDVIGVETTTHTFIAEGFFSHNSQQELVLMMILAGQHDVVERALQDGEDIHEIVTHDLGGAPKSDYLVSGVLDPVDCARVKTLLHRTDDAATREIHEIAQRADAPSLAPYDFDDNVWRSQEHYTTYKKARQKWKGVSFMILFLGGAKKLGRMALGCRCVRDGYIARDASGELCAHEGEAQRYIDAYYDKYEQVRWHQYRVKKELRATGMVREVFGTHRKLPGIFDPNKWTQLEAERMGVNFGIQRGGNALMVRALLGVNKEFRGKPPLRAPFPARLVFTVHDELIAQIREDVLEEGDYILRKHMERPHKELGGIGLRTDGAFTKAWV